MSDTTDLNDQSFNVGARLLAVRQSLGFSQRETARRAEMTNSSLSMIEQGKTSPSIQTLEKILNAFSISLAEFFSADDWQSPVIEEGDVQTLRCSGSESKAIVFDKGSLALQTINPGKSLRIDWVERRGEVVGMLLDGELELILETKRYAVRAGQGFRFSIARAHRLVNTGSKDCKISIAVFLI